MQKPFDEKETKFTLKTWILIRRAVGSLIFLSLATWIWRTWPTGNEKTLNLIFTDFDLEGIAGLTNAGRNVFLYGLVIIKIIFAIFFLPSFINIKKTLSCYSVVINKDQFIFTGLWQTRILSVKDFKEYSYIANKVHFLLHNGSRFIIHVYDFNNGDQLMKHIELAIPEFSDYPKLDEKEWVGGFPLSKIDIQLVEQRYGLSNEEAKLRLKETAKLQILSLPLAGLAVVPALLPLYPVVVYLTLKKEKLLFSLFPRSGYYSLIASILIYSFLSARLYNDHLVRTSIFSWVVSIGLALLTTLLLFKAQKSEPDEANTLKMLGPGNALLFAAMCFLSYFFTQSINCNLDFFQPEEWSVVVTEREFYTRGDDDNPMYYIKTTGKGEVPFVELKVSYETYQQLAVGDSVSQSLGRGLLGSGYFTRDPQLINK